MPGLLVSVRSASEARDARDGGAAVIDVKDPSQGPLGRASDSVIAKVVSEVRDACPVSVALGELADAPDDVRPLPCPGVRFRKLGLAGAGAGWQDAWRIARRRDPSGPAWVAVAYADWDRASAPDPGAVLEAALEDPAIIGVLVDTWDKSQPCPIAPDSFWHDWVARARVGGRVVALAGRLDRAAIERLSPLEPDLFAVRGAACRGGSRLATICRNRVAELVRLVDPLGRWRLRIGSDRNAEDREGTGEVAKVW